MSDETKPNEIPPETTEAEPEEQDSTTDTKRPNERQNAGVEETSSTPAPGKPEVKPGVQRVSQSDVQPPKDTSSLQDQAAELRERIDRLERQNREAIQRMETLQAASDSGVKDRDYFEYLVEKERSSKGAEFKLEETVASLKESKPELFGVLPATSGSAPPPKSDNRGAQLREELDSAIKSGDVEAVMAIKTKLARLEQS